MPPKEEISVTINGEPRTIRAGTTVAELVKELNIRGAAFAVERNRKVVRKAEHAGAVLSDGDVLNIVTFVGGG